jgi:3-oxo-4-pregnene-20-carboxyl-CoA dehydrogenase alpha subunit
VNIDLCAEAREYGIQTRKALEAAGGDELLRLAESSDPARRGDAVVPLLDELGAWDLDVRGDADELEAAAALCRSAGYWGIPYPVAERLSRPADLDVDALVVVGGEVVAPVAGLDLRLAAVTLDGERSIATPRPPTASPRHSGFVVPLDLTPVDRGGAKDIALALALPIWTLLGTLDRALELTRDHVLVREQFGQPLARMQGVQFQLTDAEVERTGVDVLARYALWSIQTGSDDAIEDALALRLAALDAAQVVFRVSHQLHGASGFCDETTLSWLSRYSLPVRRLPFGPSVTTDVLTRRVGRNGLQGPFGEAVAEVVS